VRVCCTHAARWLCGAAAARAPALAHLDARASAAHCTAAPSQPFVVSNGDVDHVHFERVVHGGKNFDMVVIYKAGSRDKGEEEWARISAIPMASLETVKQYLDEVAEITFSESTTNYAWKSVLEDVVRKDDFYLSEGACMACARARALGWLRALGRQPRSSTCVLPDRQSASPSPHVPCRRLA